MAGVEPWAPEAHKAKAWELEDQATHLERHANLRFRERGANTEVDAMTKCEMIHRSPGQIETLWVLEHGRITIRPAQNRGHLFPLPNPYAKSVHVSFRDANESRRGWIEAHELIYRITQIDTPRSKSFTLLGPTEQCSQTVSDRSHRHSGSG